MYSASQNKDKYTKNTEPKNPRLTFRMKNLHALPEGAERQGRLPQEILQRASGSSDAWCKSDVSLGDLNGLQVHAHMQLAAMILFPNKELRNPPYNYEQLRLPNVALTTQTGTYYLMLLRYAGCTITGFEVEKSNWKTLLQKITKVWQQCK